MSILIQTTNGKCKAWVFQPHTCRNAWENTCKMQSRNNPSSEHWKHSRKHVQKMIGTPESLKKRLKTLAKSQFRSESSPRKSRLLEKTRANWASQRSTKPNYAKSSRHSSENCRVHKKTREIPKSKRNQKRTDRQTRRTNWHSQSDRTVLCVRACVRACVHASKQGKTISRLW